jgi:hypothetical protein
VSRAQQRQRRILDVFARYPGVRLYGGDVIRMAYVNFGAAYVVLAELERSGTLQSAWADPDGPHPRRRVYWKAPP